MQLLHLLHLSYLLHLKRLSVPFIQNISKSQNKAATMATFGEWFDEIQRACEMPVRSPPFDGSGSSTSTSSSTLITPTGDFLLRRAIRSAARRPQTQGDMSDVLDLDHLWIPEFMRGGDMLILSTTAPSEPPVHHHRRRHQSQVTQNKECPLCKALVKAPTRCFAAPVSGAMATCCVCDEPFDMRSEEVVLSCMHPLCKPCWERMPGVVY